MASSNNGGGGGSGKAEEGDYLIDWHNQYSASLAFQSEALIRSIVNQIKSELTKIRSDMTFIQNELPGKHNNINKIKGTDRDLRQILDPLNELADKLRAIGSRAASKS